MVDKLFPWAKSIKWMVLRNYWNSEKKIASITVPMLLISGDSDELIPPSQMVRLFEAAKGARRKELKSVRRGDHNTTWMKAGDEYVKWLSEFIDEQE